MSLPRLPPPARASGVVRLAVILTTFYSAAAFAGEPELRMELTPAKVDQPVTERNFKIGVTMFIPDLGAARLQTPHTLSLEIADIFGQKTEWRTVFSEACKGECERRGIVAPDGGGALTHFFEVRLQRSETRFRIRLTQTPASGPERFVEQILYVPFAPEPHVHVLSVGVSRYGTFNGQQPANLCYPANDAAAFADYFRRARQSTYTGRDELLRSLRGVEVTKPLLNDGANKEDITRALGVILTQAAYTDTVVFMFSGHGYYGPALEDPLYLIPHDGVFTGDTYLFERRNLSVMALIKHFANSIRLGGPKRFIVILDTCHSGAAIIESVLADHATQAEIAILASALPRQKAKDSPKGECLGNPNAPVGEGFFAGLVLGILQGKSVGVDTRGLINESSGVPSISVLGLMEHVRRQMREVTDDQEPTVVGKMSGWLLPIVSSP